MLSSALFGSFVSERSALFSGLPVSSVCGVDVCTRGGRGRGRGPEGPFLHLTCSLFIVGREVSELSLPMPDPASEKAAGPLSDFRLGIAK